MSLDVNRVEIAYHAIEQFQKRVNLGMSEQEVRSLLVDAIQFGKRVGKAHGTGGGFRYNYSPDEGPAVYFILKKPQRRETHLDWVLVTVLPLEQSVGKHRIMHEAQAHYLSLLAEGY